jgi:HK97 family phage portal protein
MALFRNDGLMLGPSGEMLSMAAVPIMTPQNTPGLVPYVMHEPHEPWTGAFQQGYQPARADTALAFTAVYSCLSLISGDVAKCRLRLVDEVGDDIWEEVKQSPLVPVLRKPNRYQTRVQFIKSWVLAKLIFGNAYIWKDYDLRGVVTAMYPLHSPCVTPLVSDDGDVYYRIKADNLAGIPDAIEVPASRIIHDRMNPFLHPLVGIPPLFACAMTVTQGQRIQTNSAAFFANMSRPSGILTAPTAITAEQVASLKEQYEAAFRGVNMGRLLVAGNGLKYEGLTMPAEQAQLIEQLNWTDKNVCAAFLVPPHKLGLAQPTVDNAAQQDLDYYKNVVQLQFEEIEVLLEDALGLGPQNQSTYGAWFDEDNLLRMDAKTQSETNAIELGSGAMAINEARRNRNRKPVSGGDMPMQQQQMWPIDVLQDRAPPDAGGAALPAPASAEPPEEEADEEMSARTAWQVRLSLRSRLPIRKGA